jgi:hypothetical protein
MGADFLSDAAAPSFEDPLGMLRLTAASSGSC